jgi:hypothetical protein
MENKYGYPWEGTNEEEQSLERPLGMKVATHISSYETSTVLRGFRSAAAILCRACDANTSGMDNHKRSIRRTWAVSFGSIGSCNKRLANRAASESSARRWGRHRYPLQSFQFCQEPPARDRQGHYSAKTMLESRACEIHPHSRNPTYWRTDILPSTSPVYNVL